MTHNLYLRNALKKCLKIKNQSGAPVKHFFCFAQFCAQAHHDQLYQKWWDCAICLAQSVHFGNKNNNAHKAFNIYQNAIRSYEHELYTETQHKKALSANDDKVYICDNNINTYSFGHYKII